jgi:competence protein ComEC
VHDLRLLPAAAACWAGGAWLTGAGSVTAVVVALVAVVLGAAVLAGRRPVAMLLAVAAVCLAAVAGSCAWRVAAVEHSPLTALAHQQRLATLEVQVRRDAITFRHHGRESAVVQLLVRRAVADGLDVRVRDRVTAFLDGPVDDLVVGRRLVLRGRLAPSDASDEAAVVDVLRRGRVQGAAWWWEASERVRAGVRASVAHTDDDQRALVPALVDGDDARVEDEVREEFERSGLTHLMAVSGTNLTIVLAVVLVVGRGLGVRRRGLWVLGAASIAAFVLLARPDPSVVRAAAMGAVGVAAIGYGTRGGVRALSAAVVALVFLDPWLARTPGFVLSVCATAGILLLAPVVARPLLRWMPRWCALALAVPLAAQLACTPALAAISGEVSLVAVVANVLAAPAVAPATVAGLVGGLLAVVAPAIGQVPGTAAGWCAGWILAVAHHSASLESASVAWRAPWQALLLLVPLVAWGLVRLAARPVLFLGLVLGLLVGLWRPPQSGWPPAGWVLVACDVGQGDATVLDAGDGGAVVVDAGPDAAAVDRCLDRLGVDRVRLLVFTHGHADHVDGWRGVRAGRPVDQVAVGPTGGPTVPGAQRHVAAAGETMRAGRVSATVLWPPASAPSARAVDESATNDASVVLNARVGRVRLLLTGDVEPTAQDDLLRAGADVAADVLKMPHHGSARQSERFLDAVGARVTTISAGADNDYGHPAAGALAMLRERGVRWWRTDTDGDVAVVVRDGAVRVVTR